MKRERGSWWDAEIDWLVNCAEGEHGRRAVPLEPSMGGNPDTMDDLRREAAARARRVTTALASLPDSQRRLLLAAHEYVAPGRCREAHAAHRTLCDRVSDLMVAVGAFRRAWRVLGASQGTGRRAA